MTRSWPVLGAAGRAAALALVAAVLVAAAAALAWWWEEALGLATASPERMGEAIRGWGAWGPLASVGLMVAHSFIPFPAELLAVANGMAFGLLPGIATTWAGAMLGAWLAFGLARRLGRPFVHRVVAERHWRRIEDWVERGGAGGLLLARLLPVISFNLVNYAAGLAGVGWWRFTWTTAVGILPVTVLSVLVGSHLVEASWPAWAAFGLAAALLLALHLRRRRG
jgi:uncharacterized membrane protein YdjX (TVP38/TMEM64 family)